VEHADEGRVERLVRCERERGGVVDVWTEGVPAA
jgi:hypothetical protein